MGNPVSVTGQSFHDLTVRRPTRKDIIGVAKHLRRADSLEMEAVGFGDWKASDVLLAACSASESVYTARDPEGSPVLLIGYGESGDLWMMGTDDIRQHGLGVTKLAQAVVAEGLEAHEELHNHVHAKNRAHVRFLTRLGAEVGEDNGRGFIPFTFKGA